MAPKTMNRATPGRLLTQTEQAALAERMAGDPSTPDHVQLPVHRAWWSKGLVWICKDGSVMYECLGNGAYDSSTLARIEFVPATRETRWAMFLHVRASSSPLDSAGTIQVIKFGEVEMTDLQKEKLKSWERVRFSKA